VVKKLSDLYLDTRRALLDTEDSQTASLYARNIVCRFTGKTQEMFLADRDKYVTEETCQAVESAVARVLDGEPLAYVLEEWDFYGMRLQVNPNVLIPRDDTCAVTALAIKKALFLNHDPRILDLCTGSGCIGLAVAHRVKDARVTLADISQEALAVAKRNAVAQKLSGRVSCVHADALAEPAPFLGKFDMIISNPPYITAGEMLELPDSVKNYEPHLALYGGEDGLDFYRAIASKYRNALRPGGYLCFEFGAGQGDAVCEILEMNGYTILERTRDYNDRERAVIAQYSRKED
jgi:release factor glutamine methyltransferase